MKLSTHVTETAKLFFCCLLILLFSCDAFSQVPIQGLTYEQQQQLSEANRLSKEGAKLGQSGNLDLAVDKAKRATTIFETVQGKQSPAAIFHQHVVGLLLSQQSKEKESIPFLERAYSGGVQINGESHDQTLKTLQYLSAAYIETGEFVKSESLSLRLVELTEQKRGKFHAESEMARKSIYALYIKAKRIDDLKAYAQKIRDSKVARFGSQSRDSASAFNLYGQLCIKINELDDAKENYLRSLAILQTSTSEFDESRLEPLQWLATIANRNNDHTSAQNYLKRAIRISRNISGEASPETVLYREMLADSHYRSGDRAVGIKQYEALVQLQRKTYGTKNAATASAIANLGSVYFWSGEYGQARKYVEEALDIRKSLYGMNHLEVADSLFIWGGLLGRQGEFRGSLNTQLQALKIRENRLPKGHADIASSLEAVGGAYQGVGQIESASPYFERSLKIFKNLYGPDHPRTAETEKNYGVHLANRGRFDDALPYLKRSVELRTKLDGSSDWTTAASLEDLAWVYYEKKEMEKARDLYERALKIRSDVQGQYNPFTTKTLLSVALLDFREGKIADAIEKFDKVRRGATEHVNRVLPSLNESEQLKFLQNRFKSEFQNLVSFIGYEDSSQDLIDKTLSWVLNGKSIRLNSLVNRRKLNSIQQSDKALQAKFDQLNALRQQLSSSTFSRIQEGSPDVALLRKSENDLSRQLQVRISELLPPSASWVELEQVREKIPADAVLIEIARNWTFDASGTHYFAWIVPGGSREEVKFLDLGDADVIDREIDAVLESLRSVIKTGELKKEGESKATESLRRSFSSIQNLVWKPIREKLGENVEHLIVSPDGALWLLPWSAIPTAENRFLLEDYVLQFEVSGRELANVEGSQTSKPRSYIFADPNYDLKHEETRQAIRAMFPKKKLSDLVSSSPASKTPLNSVARLPNTKAEAEAVAPSIEKIDGRLPQTYTGKWALETVLKSVHRPKHLLLSTHGFFLPNQVKEGPPRRFGDLARNDETRGALPRNESDARTENPLLRCGLLLAGCNSGLAVGGDDGIFTGLEVASLDLSGTEIVVLSACETAVGDIRNGEGVAGLRQAFQSAGAQSVVATLWQVPDRDSSIVMSDFFKNLAKGQSRSEALRIAQLNRIKARRTRNGAAHPFFWAAWTLTGVGRSDAAAGNVADRSKVTRVSDAALQPTNLRNLSSPRLIGHHAGVENSNLDFNQLLKAAEGGDVDAQYVLGLAYKGIHSVQFKSLKTKLTYSLSISGNEQFVDEQISTDWLLKAAKQGHPESQYELGRNAVYYDQTLGCNGWLCHAALQKHPQALLLLGLYQGKYWTTGIEEAAAAGDADAKSISKLKTLLENDSISPAQRFELGILCQDVVEKLTNNKKNIERAKSWPRREVFRARKAGIRIEELSGYLQYRLGLVYESAAEIEQAFRCFRASAEKGYVNALYRLGRWFEDGDHVDKNIESSAKYYRRAAEMGHSNAQRKLSFCYFSGIGLAKNSKRAFLWMEKSAFQDNAISQHLLGTFYLTGEGVEVDAKSAMDWWLEAARNGSFLAQNRLGEIYAGSFKHSELDVKMNIEKAKIYYRLAAAQAYGPAQFNLGELYLEGRGVDRDLELVIHWMEKSGNNGFENAQHFLGNFYSDGKLTRVNRDKAKSWFQKAADQGSVRAKERLQALSEK